MKRTHSCDSCSSIDALQNQKSFSFTDLEIPKQIKEIFQIPIKTQSSKPLEFRFLNDAKVESTRYQEQKISNVQDKLTNISLIPTIPIIDECTLGLNSSKSSLPQKLKKKIRWADLPTVQIDSNKTTNTTLKIDKKNNAATKPH